MKIYVEELPKSCAECEFSWKLKPPTKRPEVECMHCNLMKKLDKVSEFCPLQSLADHGEKLSVAEKALELACEHILKTDREKCKVCQIHGNDSCGLAQLMCEDYISLYFKARAKELKDGKID